MFYAFATACLVAWLATQANDPVSATLGFVFAGWLFLSGLIVTYHRGNDRQE